jgi:hypothetical protein
MSALKTLVFGIAFLVGSVTAFAEPIRLTSDHLPERVGGYHTFWIEFELTGDSGKGTLNLDPNRCGLTEFGDTSFCTLIATSQHEVTLAKVSTEDASGKGRTLWKISGADSVEGALHLVVPKAGETGYRLVHTGDEDRRIVIPMTKLPPAAP